MITDPLAGLPAQVRERILHVASTPSASASGPLAFRVPKAPPTVALSHEQQRLLEVVRDGRDVIVDATVGSGKTTAIQALCAEMGRDRKVLYLTYSKLLKLDAQRRVGSAKVQNYHGVVYPALLHAGIKCGIGESIKRFNESFTSLSANFARYDLIVVDEYQDVTEEYAQLLRNIKSLNPMMQVVMVGDLAQKVRSDTTLDAQRFAQDFCEQPELLPFTQSFRVGPELGELLGEAWNKPVIGVNTTQQVHYVSYDEALQLISAKKPGELLCLGSRNGQMSEALNYVEREHADVFNKDTVYASIKDGDTSVSYGDDAAVFTTFDSSKGLERSTSVVFDYDERMWDVRNGFPGADPTVLRNIFLVAASRGKQEVVFVRPDKARRNGRSIGFIPVQRFSKLPAVEAPVYDEPVWASGCFDFKYAENVEACFDLLETTRLDDGSSEEILIERTDGLIDLSPAVGHYQEAAFFDGYDPAKEVLQNPKPMAKMLSEELGADPWRNSLLLTAVDSDQLRYADQVTRRIGDDVRDALVARLATQLPRDCDAQVPLELTGTAEQTRDRSTPIVFRGVADAVHMGQVYELKFVSELSHAMFLQLALYLVMGGFDSGVLWNTRTDERWSVKVPDRERFLHAVVRCVTKQHYRAFQAATRRICQAAR